MGPTRVVTFFDQAADVWRYRVGEEVVGAWGLPGMAIAMARIRAIDLATSSQHQVIHEVHDRKGDLRTLHRYGGEGDPAAV